MSSKFYLFQDGVRSGNDVDVENVDWGCEVKKTSTDDVGVVEPSEYIAF